MADIAAFRGVLYDSSRVQPTQAIAPPYDVINDADRARLESLSPNNAVRLILPQGDGDARYANAAELFERWMAEGVLLRDQRPALYRYHQIFTVQGREYTRRGFIALIRLTPFSERVVLPHERTLSGPKEDRLKLMRATRAHFSQVFGLYEDPASRVDSAFADCERVAPVLEGKTFDGVRHRVFRLTDPAAIRSVVQELAPKKIYIADGHHRYETMIALREELRRAHPGAPAGSSIDFGSIFLMNVADPGLVVLPTHRLVVGLAGFELGRLIDRAKELFTTKTVVRTTPQVIAAALADTAASGGPTFGVAGPSPADPVHLLTIRPEAERALAEAGVDPALRALDVTILHALVIERLCGIDKAAQEKQTHLRYVKDLGQALQAAEKGEAQAAFLMNPTRVEQVVRAADAGCVMPQKSTFFYPKIASGLVMNRIVADETVAP